MLPTGPHRLHERRLRPRLPRDQDPLTDEHLCPYDSGLPCTEDAPDTALVYHRDCQNRKSCHEAVTQAQE